MGEDEPEQPPAEEGVDDADETEEKTLSRKERKRRGTIVTRRKKEFTYRGFTLEQLKKMTLNELLPLLPARARRSLKRGLNEDQKTFVERFLNANKPVLRTHCRDIIILPAFVGKKVAVYNGKEWKEFEIKSEMIGHYLGEFSLTRKPVKHSGPGVGATRSSKFMPLK
jgi:small subunit ribosomal protein S19